MYSALSVVDLAAPPPDPPPLSTMPLPCRLPTTPHPSKLQRCIAQKKLKQVQNALESELLDNAINWSVPAVLCVL